jgi:hypothetical protein
VAVQFCGTCGHPLIPEQLFCQHCGSRADDNATRGATPATPGIPVSSAGTLYCGQCGALVGSQERVCRRCGAPVEAVQGGISDPSLSDLPTQMGTPPPAANLPPPAYQPPTNAIGAPPSGPRYADQPATNWGNQPPPGWANQPAAGGWAASYSPAPSYDESPTFTVGAPAPRPAVQTPPPPYHPTPGGPPRRSQRWPLIIAIVLVALALIAGGGIFLMLYNSNGTSQTNGGTTPGVTQTAGVTATAIPSPTPVVLTNDTAKALIQQYYDDINARKYDDAYDLLAPEWQQTKSREDFVNGYQTTVSVALTILGAEPASGNTIQVDVKLKAVDNKNGSEVTTNYAGYYIVTLENGKLLMLSGKVDTQ